MKVRQVNGVAAPEPESELLLRAARPGAEPGNDGRIRVLLRGSLDWDLLLRAAQTHGVMPLLHWHLQRQAWAAVPTGPRDALQGEFRRNAVLNLARTGELLRLLRLFRDRGISVLAFKGPTLAAYAYSDLSLRCFSDLDLLLRPAQLVVGEEALLAAGYAMALELPSARQADYLRSIGQLPFCRARDGSLVELHSRLTPQHFHFPLRLEDLWSRVQRVDLLGEEIAALSAEDLLLVLAAHAAKHLFTRLGWVSDLAAVLLRCPTLDLGRVFHRARQLRCQRLLLVSLRLAYNLLQECPPDVVVRNLRADATAGCLAAQVWRRFAGGRPPGTVEGGLFHLLVREDFKDGLAYGMSLALQPTTADWDCLALHQAASPLFFFLRPLRLAFKYGTRLLARFGGN
jgi:hypothetical protein